MICVLNMSMCICIRCSRKVVDKFHKNTKEAVQRKLSDTSIFIFNYDFFLMSERDTGWSGIADITSSLLFKSGI